MKIKIVKPDKNFKEANRLIDRLKLINNHKYNITICIDYSIKDAGLYYPDDPYKILINPENCQKTINSLPGYTNDKTTFGVILHEFAHFLSMIYFKNFVTLYELEFEKKLIISHYKECKHDIEEEIADVLILYISNPYFLRLISEEHYKFIKHFFKSPTPCTKKRFINIYRNFPESTKQKIKEKWNINILGDLIINKKKKKKYRR